MSKRTRRGSYVSTSTLASSKAPAGTRKQSVAMDTSADPAVAAARRKARTAVVSKTGNALLKQSPFQRICYSPRYPFAPMMETTYEVSVDMDMPLGLFAASTTDAVTARTAYGTGPPNVDTGSNPFHLVPLMATNHGNGFSNLFQIRAVNSLPDESYRNEAGASLLHELMWPSHNQAVFRHTSGSAGREPANCAHADLFARLYRHSVVTGTRVTLSIIPSDQTRDIGFTLGVKKQAGLHVDPDNANRVVVRTTTGQAREDLPPTSINVSGLNKWHTVEAGVQYSGGSSDIQDAYRSSGKYNPQAHACGVIKFNDYRNLKGGSLIDQYRMYEKGLRFLPIVPRNVNSPARATVFSDHWSLLADEGVTLEEAMLGTHKLTGGDAEDIIGDASQLWARDHWQTWDAGTSAYQTRTRQPAASPSWFWWIQPDQTDSDWNEVIQNRSFTKDTGIDDRDATTDAEWLNELHFKVKITMQYDVAYWSLNNTELNNATAVDVGGSVKQE